MLTNFTASQGEWGQREEGGCLDVLAVWEGFGFFTTDIHRCTQMEFP
jgi:hypothetical protein